MEITQPDTGKHTDSAVLANMINQRCEIRLYGIQPIGDLAQMPLETLHPGGPTLPIVRDWFGRLRWPASVQYRVDMVWMPAQCDRERFQGPSASPSLHDVMLKLPNGRPRNMRASASSPCRQPSSFTRTLIASTTAAQSSTYSSALRLGAEISDSPTFPGTTARVSRSRAIHHAHIRFLNKSTMS
ncbi:MAG TPA: hypothetical protein VFW64_10865 [Pseudonocardiaceae bacterium]|nr:hypothetical protein [Pseudonocardiaceae bacterium]